MDSFFSQFAIRLRGHRTLTLILLAGFTLLTGFFTLYSRVDNSLAVWQSADDSHWLQYQDFVGRYHITDPLIVYLPGIDLFALEDTADALNEKTGAATIQTLSIKPLLGGVASLFFILPREQSTPADLAALLAEVEEVLQHQGVRYHLGGVWYLTTMLDALSAGATQTLFPVVLAILALGVTILLRNRRNTLLVLLCGFVPAIQVTGLMALAGVKLNMVLLALPPFAMILGIAHAIHLVLKQPDQRHPDSAGLFAQVAAPCLLSGLTTMLGFLSLVLSTYLPVQQLGIWGTVASILSLANSFILLPLFFEPSSSRPIAMPEAMMAFMARYRQLLAGIFLLLVLLATFGISRLNTGSLILDFFKDKAMLRQNYHTIENSGVGLTPFEVDLGESRINNDVLQATFADFAGDTPVITQIFYYFADGMVLTSSTASGARFPMPLSIGEIKERPQRATLLLKTLASEPTLALAEKLESFLQKHLGPQDHPYVTGSVPLYTRGQQHLFSSLLMSFGCAFFSISLVMGLALRSIHLGLLAIVPNILPVFFILALMGWFSIPLSVATVTVASIVFGIVVDDSIHFLHRFQKEEKTPGTIMIRLQNALHSTGPAMLTTTLIAGTGFLGFIVSPFIPLRNFGLLISGSLWLAILCDLVLLPLLILLWKE
ncbi:MAG: MMPL family transporter [Pseudomonadota bacterium]